ncbi:hypothetical protein HNV12_00575 [Methanococcoides sp. SA1]|nr:hypothetical protein [Methanococcoides sp. SA1]
MKSDFGIILMCSVLVLIVGFVTFNSEITGGIVGVGSSGITGHVVLNETEIGGSWTEVKDVNVSRDDVVLRMEEVQEIVLEMVENDFSVVYFEDKLIEAERVFQQVDYAEMLRGNLDASEAERSEARFALALIDWRTLDYTDVLVSLDDMVERRDSAFEIFDSINIVERSVEKYEEFDMSEARGFLIEARTAFEEERYGDAEEFLDKARESVDVKSSEASLLGGLKRGVTNFFYKYWIYVLLFFVLIGFVGAVFYKNIQKWVLKRRILKMKTEEKVLLDLMQKSQRDRFQDNKISGLVYNIRMKKYEEKLAEIKRMLPVLEKQVKLS